MLFAILCVIMALFCYLVGGINGAILFSSLVFHQDIRKFGSGNPGFTNFKRVYGNKPISWIVLIFDLLKTAVPVLVSGLVFHFVFGMWQFGAAFGGLFCMLGHCFPVWYKFKGGKAFIAGAATACFVDWRMALIALGVFLIMLGLFRFMSVASCSAALACPIALAILGPSYWFVEVISALSALLVIVRHKDNFVKLAKGTESKFSLK